MSGRDSTPKAKPPASPVIPVGLAPARVGALDVYLDAIGTVAAPSGACSAACSATAPPA